MTLTIRSIRSLLVALGLSLILVAVTTPSEVQAAGLTTPQINAVIGLLEAFDVPQATITQVSSILKGQSSPETEQEDEDEDEHEEDEDEQEDEDEDEEEDEDEDDDKNCSSNSGRGNCEDQDRDSQDNQGSSEETYVGPTVVVTYPNSKGPYDITRDNHYGTRLLVSWRTYNLSVGSKACTYLRNMSTGVDYPLPETDNCIWASTGTNKQGSNHGYARVPAGNNYRAKVVIYDGAKGSFVTQALNSTAFSMANMDRNSQEKKAARDTTTTDSAGYVTVGGSATVPSLYISVHKGVSTVHESGLFAVVNGRWSYKLTTALAKGTYTIALLDQAGNVLDSGSVYVNPSNPTDSTSGTSVTQATLTATASAGSMWVSFKGSTGQGCDGKTYTLDYGNGVNSAIPIQSGSCQPIFTRSYPYSSAGTYTVRLLAPATCSTSGACTDPAVVITTTVTVPGPTSGIPQDSLVASLGFLPESLYETMAGVTDFLAAVEMAPVYVITEALSDFLFEAGLY